MPGGWVYIVTNRPNGTLYVGVTSNLARRVWEHREGVSDSFTKKYGLKRLVWAECHDDIARRDPARAQREALAPGLEGPADPPRKPGLARPLRPTSVTA